MTYTTPESIEESLSELRKMENPDVDDAIIKIYETKRAHLVVAAGNIADDPSKLDALLQDPFVKGVYVTHKNEIDATIPKHLGLVIALSDEVSNINNLLKNMHGTPSIETEKQSDSPSTEITELGTSPLPKRVSHSAPDVKER